MSVKNISIKHLSISNQEDNKLKEVIIHKNQVVALNFTFKTLIVESK